MAKKRNRYISVDLKVSVDGLEHGSTLLRLYGTNREADALAWAIRQDAVRQTYAHNDARKMPSAIIQMPPAHAKPCVKPILPALDRYPREGDDK